MCGIILLNEVFGKELTYENDKGTDIGLRETNVQDNSGRAVLPDGTVDAENIYPLLDMSYDLTLKKPKRVK